MGADGKLAIENPKVQMGALRVAAMVLAGAAALTSPVSPLAATIRSGSAALDIKADSMDPSLTEFQRGRNIAAHGLKVTASLAPGGAAAALAIDIGQKAIQASKTLDAVADGAKALGISGGEAIASIAPTIPVKTPEPPKTVAHTNTRKA